MGRPKKAKKTCKDCGKEIARRSTRCQSCSAKFRYRDPEERKRQSLRKKGHWERGDYDSPEYRRKMSESMKIARRRGIWDTPEAIHKRSEGIQKAWARGDFDQHSEKVKAAWERGAYDEIHTQEVRDNLAKIMKRRRANGEFDGMFTPEVRNKISAKVKAAWQNSEYYYRQCKASRKLWRDPEYRRKQSEGFKKALKDPKLHHKMSEIRKQAWKDGVYDDAFQFPTSIELAVIAALNICGIEHISQYRPAGYCRIYDEFIQPNILIEIHGDYWHGPERPEIQWRDVEKARWAKENGYHLVVIWEHEIKKCGARVLVIERILPLMS